MVEIANQNFLQATAFQFVIHHERYKHTQWFCQSVDIPSVSMIPVDVGSAEISTIPVVGDKLYYPELNLNIILDEDMFVYKELYKWLQAVTHNPQTLDTANTGIPEKLDISVLLLRSSNNPSTKFTFLDAFPISIGDFTMMSDEPSHEPIRIQCSFQFTKFTIEDVNKS